MRLTGGATARPMNQSEAQMAAVRLVAATVAGRPAAGRWLLAANAIDRPTENVAGYEPYASLDTERRLLDGAHLASVRLGV